MKTNENIPTQSDIRSMTLLCDDLNAINLSQGICDLPISHILKYETIQSLEEGYNSYSSCYGVDILRDALSRRYKNYYGVERDLHNIIISSGATGAFYISLLALYEPGDEILFFEPYYEYHINLARFVGFYTRFFPMDASNQWMIDFTELSTVITPKTKAIVISNPTNPCGKVFSKDELLTLKTLCDRHGIWLISDEIYEYFVYDGRPYTSLSMISSPQDRCIVISGFSKIYSITGWRVGYCIVPSEIVDNIAAINDIIYVCAPTPLQFGIAKALDNLPDTFYNLVCRRYEKKRDYMCERLTKAGYKCYVPEGAYYILVDVHQIKGETSKQKAENILKTYNVATVPGSAFYHNRTPFSDNIVRICFARDFDILIEACDRLSPYEDLL